MTEVEIRCLHEVSDMIMINDLVAEIWQTDPGDSPADAGWLRALAHAGNYVAGAFVSGADRMQELVGAGIAFFAEPDPRTGKTTTLHSHIVGVRRSMAGAGLGTAIKQHQRQWCQKRGLTTMTWTFDPLIARNAYFNLARLGADLDEYLVDFYGPMSDGINAGQPTDRALVRWTLDRVASPSAVVDHGPALLAVATDGEPVMADPPAGAVTCALQIPADIEKLRTENPQRALRWRLALRASFANLADWTCVTFDKSAGYVMRRN